MLLTYKLRRKINTSEPTHMLISSLTCSILTRHRFKISDAHAAESQTEPPEATQKSCDGTQQADERKSLAERAERLSLTNL